MALNANREESTLIRLLVLYGNFPLDFEYTNENDEIETSTLTTAEFIMSELSEDQIQFTNRVYAKIYSEFISSFEKNKNILLEKHFILHSDPEISKIASEFLSEKHELSDWSKKEIFVPSEKDKLFDLVNEGVLRLKSKQVKLKIQTMLEKMKNKKILEEDQTKFMTHFQQLNKLSKLFDKALGRDC